MSTGYTYSQLDLKNKSLDWLMLLFSTDSPPSQLDRS
jgi:hypothetical protein